MKSRYFFGLQLAGAAALIALGLATLLRQDTAVRVARLWTGWSSAPQSRSLGFGYILAGLVLLIGPLFEIFGHVPISKTATTTPVSYPHSVDTPMAIAGILSFGLSVYMLADPLGLYCFFKRQKRDRFPGHYRRGWPVTIMALTFIALTGYFLYSLIMR